MWILLTAHTHGGIYAKEAITAALGRFVSGAPPLFTTSTGWHPDPSRADPWSWGCPDAAPSRNTRSGREGELHLTRAPQSALGTGVSHALSTPPPMPRGRPGHSGFRAGGGSRYRHRDHLGVQPPWLLTREPRLRSRLSSHSSQQTTWWPSVSGLMGTR